MRIIGSLVSTGPDPLFFHLVICGNPAHQKKIPLLEMCGGKRHETFIYSIRHARNPVQKEGKNIGRLFSCKNQYRNSMLLSYVSFPKSSTYKYDFLRLIDRSYGVKRVGSRGNIDVLRILLRLRNNITTRSIPIPPPPCG